MVIKKKICKLLVQIIGSQLFTLSLKYLFGTRISTWRVPGIIGSTVAQPLSWGSQCSVGRGTLKSTTSLLR